MQGCDFPLSCQQKQHFEFWLIIQLEEFQSSLQISRRTTRTWIVTETKQDNRRRKCKISVRKHCASHWQSAKSLKYTSLPLTSAATTPTKHKLQESETRCEVGRPFTSSLFERCLEVELSVNSSYIANHQSILSFFSGASSLCICNASYVFWDLPTVFILLCLYFLLTSSSSLIISNSSTHFTIRWYGSCPHDSLAKSIQMQQFLRNFFIEMVYPAWEVRKEER